MSHGGAAPEASTSGVLYSNALEFLFGNRFLEADDVTAPMLHQVNKFMAATLPSSSRVVKLVDLPEKLSKKELEECLLEACKHSGCPPHLAIAAAARQGNVSCCQRLRHRHLPVGFDGSEVFRNAALAGTKGIDVLRWGRRIGMRGEWAAWEGAAAAGSQETLEWLKSNGFNRGDVRDQRAAMNEAAKHNMTVSLHYLYHHGWECKFETWVTGWRHSAMESLLWMIRYKYGAYITDQMEAAYYGNVEFLRSVPVPEIEVEAMKAHFSVSYFAALAGHEAVLQYLHSIGKLKIWHAYFGASIGSTAALKWMLARFMDLRYKEGGVLLIGYAIALRRMENVKLLREHGFHWDHRAWMLAECDRNWAGMEYLHKHGCPGSEAFRGRPS